MHRNVPELRSTLALLVQRGVITDDEATGYVRRHYGVDAPARRPKTTTRHLCRIHEARTLRVSA